MMFCPVSLDWIQMLLSYSLALLFLAQINSSFSKSDRTFAVPYRFAYWPSSDIPFEIDYSLIRNDKFRSLLSEAMKEIEIRTCIKFIPGESLGKRYKSKMANLKPIIFNSSQTECTTHLTMSAREETRILLTKNCSEDYTFVAGNLVRALGFIPEHARSDRDQYITILEPIRSDSNANDSLWNIVLNSGLHSNVSNVGEFFYTPYDIYSITHMPSYPLNDTHLGPVVLHKNRGDQAACLDNRVLSYDRIPSAKRLSSFDVTKINLRYECGFKSRTCNDTDEKMCLEEGLIRERDLYSEAWSSFSYISRMMHIGEDAPNLLVVHNSLENESIGFVSENKYVALETLNKCGDDKFAWDKCPRTCGRCYPERMSAPNIVDAPPCDAFPVSFLPERNVSDQKDVLYQALACVCSTKDYAETLSDETIKYFCDVYSCKTYMKYLC